MEPSEKPKQDRIYELQAELQVSNIARRELFDALAKLVNAWDGEETPQYIHAKWVLAQWNEDKS
jgi:hypothetical protein